MHFHVLASGTQAAQGNIPTAWINAQIDTLNKAFSLAGVTFVLASISRTVNAAWYNMQQGGKDEVREHRQSIRKALGVSSQPGGVIRTLE